MSDKLLLFQCLISGFDYELMKQSSIKSKKKALIYSNAILIIAFIWLGMGLGIGALYGGGSTTSIYVLGAICPLLIILIERIIVQTPNNYPTFALRLLIGLLISTVGSTLITQILFSNDIIKQQRENRKQERTVKLETERAEINDQIRNSQKIVAGKDAIVDRFQTDQQGLTQSIGKTTSSAVVGIIRAEQQRIGDKSNRLSEINKELREIDATIASEMESVINRRSILDDLKAVDQITSSANVDDEVLGVFNNQAHFFKWVLFSLILVFELLVVAIKMVTTKDEFDYQVYIEGSNQLGIDIAKSRFDNQLKNSQAEGFRSLAKKLLRKY